MDDEDVTRGAPAGPAFSPVPIGSGARQGGKDHQEDNFASFTSVNNKVIIGGIWDGHGGWNGKVASEKARNTSLQYFQEHSLACESWTVEEWKHQLSESFRLAHQAIRDCFINDTKDAHNPNARRVLDDKGIVRSPAGDPVHGGTTATVVVCIRPSTPEGKLTLICANCGDSTALVVDLGECPPEQKCTHLSDDHGPESDVEYKRVQALDCKIKLLFVYDKTNVFRKYECPLVFREDGTKDQKFIQNPWANGLHPTNVRYEPAVYAVTPQSITKDSTCIAMTRALGDFYAHQFGLTAVPSINVHELDAKGDYCILAGSDGIWDCWRYNDFANFIALGINQENLDAPLLSEKVLNESIKRAIANFGQRHYDDASFVCWRMCPGARSESELRQSRSS